MGLQYNPHWLKGPRSALTSGTVSSGLTYQVRIMTLVLTESLCSQDIEQKQNSVVNQEP